MNTRQYHRNSALAWPKTASYACAIERPARESAADIALAILIGIGLAAALVGWWS